MVPEALDRLAMPLGGAPMVSAGFPQAPEFPTFEALNRGEVDVRPVRMTQSKNLTYERVRNFVVSPTWSS